MKDPNALKFAEIGRFLTEHIPDGYRFVLVSLDTRRPSNQPHVNIASNFVTAGGDTDRQAHNIATVLQYAASMAVNNTEDREAAEYHFPPPRRHEEMIVHVDIDNGRKEPLCGEDIDGRDGHVLMHWRRARDQVDLCQECLAEQQDLVDEWRAGHDDTPALDPPWWAEA